MKSKEKQRPAFNLRDFLTKTHGRSAMADYADNAVIFSQGDPADAIFYITAGTVKLSAVSQQGKAAIVAILNTGNFFGEGCLAGQKLRMATATAFSECSLMKLEKAESIRLIHDEPSFSDLLLTHVLARNIKTEEDLVNQLFDSTEKRVARALLVLAKFGQEGPPETVIPKISQETLADMVGTTRSRVSFFMNKFRRLGFIQYNGTLEVHSSLLNVILHD